MADRQEKKDELEIVKNGKFKLDSWSITLLTSMFLISGGFVTSAIMMVTVLFYYIYAILISNKCRKS